MSDVNVSGNLSVTKNGVIDKDLLVKGWLYAANVRDMYVGVFESSSQLPADAKEKSIAGVVTTVSGVEKIIAWYKGRSGWESTGAELSVDVDTSIQQQINAINAELAQKAKSSDVIPRVENVNEEIPQFKSDGTLGSSTKKLRDFSLANHNHNGLYAAIGHTHAGVYSPVSHNHAGVYAPVSHNHAGVYAPVSHQHTDLETNIETLRAAIRGGEMVRVTFNVTTEGSYSLYRGEAEDILGMIIEGDFYPNEEVPLETGNVTVGFIFANAYKIPDGAFDNDEETAGITITKVHLPSYIHGIGNKTFRKCAGLENGFIECEALTPPSIESDSFDDVATSNVDMRIHAIAYEVYRELDFTLCDMSGRPIQGNS